MMSRKKSHPSWVRGLKLDETEGTSCLHHVAPLVGAWIETADAPAHGHGNCVAPLVGAWIETKTMLAPMLKSTVAPLVGAWIETKVKGTIQ